jgi:hypothetical protein
LTIDSFGKLFTSGGEILAEGNCQVDEEKGIVTMRPLVDTPMLSRETNDVRLELENGTQYWLSPKAIRFRLNVPGVPPGPAYRFSFVGNDRRRANSEGEAS